MPSTIYEGSGKVEFKFRLKRKVVKQTIVAKCRDVILGKKFVYAGVPGEMGSFEFDKSGATEKITLSIE